MPPHCPHTATLSAGFPTTVVAENIGHMCEPAGSCEADLFLPSTLLCHGAHGNACDAASAHACGTGISRGHAYMCHVSVLDAALRVFVVCRGGGWLTRHSLDNHLQRGAWRARGAPFLHPFPFKAGADQEQRWVHIHLLGAFSHSAGTAPIITVVIQVTTLKTTHLRNHAQSIQNSKIQTYGSQGPKFCPL